MCCSNSIIDQIICNILGTERAQKYSVFWKYDKANIVKKYNNEINYNENCVKYARIRVFFDPYIPL